MKILSPENKVVLVKRVKSLLWRASMMLAALLVSFGLENLQLLELSPSMVVFLGLLFGEVSKWLNKQRVKFPVDSQ